MWYFITDIRHLHPGQSLGGYTKSSVTINIFREGIMRVFAVTNIMGVMFMVVLNGSKSLPNQIKFTCEPVRLTCYNVEEVQTQLKSQNFLVVTISYPQCSPAYKFWPAQSKVVFLTCLWACGHCGIPGNSWWRWYSPLSFVHEEETSGNILSKSLKPM